MDDVVLFIVGWLAEAFSVMTTCGSSVSLVEDLGELVGKCSLNVMFELILRYCCVCAIRRIGPCGG